VLRIAARDDDGSWTGSILQAIDSDTAVVSVPVCHWTDGARIGIEAVARRARSVGAALVIDASQSLGIMPFDVRELDPDFVVSVGYKWLLGPFGMSYLYVAPRHQSGRSIEDAWAMHRGSQDLTRLTVYQTEFRDGARRFDAGEHQNFILLPMAIAALEHAQRWHAARIDAWLSRLTKTLADIGASLGYQPTPDSVRSPHFLGLNVGGERAREITAALRGDGVYVATRGSAIRHTCTRRRRISNASPVRSRRPARQPRHTDAGPGFAGTWVSSSLEAVKPMSSCLAQGDQRVHLRRAPRWEVAGENSDGKQQ
jgi:selenocysteine lyase/cysteine desulfurase